MAENKSTNSEEILSDEDIEHLDSKGPFKDSTYGYFTDLSGDAFQNLSKSDYAKVIFCDLYYNTDSTVGCKFQITDDVHEDPCDYIGLYKVGYDSLSQCLASKLLSRTECEEDGKLLRCTFKPNELPDIEPGFYQFLYVTRDQEVCGASMPFEIKNMIPKDVSSDEDIVADRTEDDFLVVRSNAAEKCRRLQLLLDEMNEKCLIHESEMRKIQTKFKIITEEKFKLEQLLKKACEEKKSLIEESRKLVEEKDTIASEKETAIRILKEKNNVLSTIFDDFTCKLKAFTELKDTLEADKELAIAENNSLQERLKKLTEEIQNKQQMFEEEKERNQELIVNLKKDNSILASQLDDAKLMIEALEKSKHLSMTDLSCLSQTVSELKQKFKDMKCENFALKSKLQDTTSQLKEKVGEIHDMKSGMAALKLHIIEMEESQQPVKAQTSASSSSVQDCSTSTNIPIIIEEKPQIVLQEESVQTSPSEDSNKDLKTLKSLCDKLHADVVEKSATIVKLREELVKSNAVVDYLTKERDTVHQNESRAQEALSECLLRLNEASELYKKQYRKIEKLKKKLKKDKTSEQNSELSSDKDLSLDLPSVKNIDSTAVETNGETVIVDFTRNHTSDSDTGEHVSRYPFALLKEVNLTQNMASCSTSSLLQQPSSSKYVPKIRDLPELQNMIEENLVKLSCSRSKADEETLYTIPCPVCNEDIGVYMSSTDEMLKHLEVQHKQQLCPICGRLFDMTLPSKYFVFHVEDHFQQGHE